MSTGWEIHGIHIFAEEANEVIQVLAIAVGSGAIMKDFASVIAVHPTIGEEIGAMQTPTVRYDRREASTPLVQVPPSDSIGSHPKVPTRNCGSASPSI